MEIKGKVLKNGLKSGIFLKEQQVFKSELKSLQCS